MILDLFFGKPSISESPSQASRIRLFCFAWTPFRPSDEAIHQVSCDQPEPGMPLASSDKRIQRWSEATAAAEAVLQEVRTQFSKCDGHAFFSASEDGKAC